MHCEVRTLNCDEYPVWDALVDESPRGTLFHKSYWLPHPGGSFVIYGCFRGGELVGGVPVAFRRTAGIRIASRIGTPYSGILFKEQDYKYVNRLADEKELGGQLARSLKHNFHVVVLGYAPGAVDLQPLIWEGFSVNPQYTYLISLEHDTDHVWRGMGESTRRSIRKAEKDGITVERSDDPGLALEFYRDTLARKNMSTRLSAVYRRRHETLIQKTQCKSFLAKDAEGKCVAGIYLVWDNKRSYYLVGGRDSENGHYGAAALVIWEAARYTKNELGLNEFDLLGSMIPEVERFFRGFGGRLSVRFRAVWVKPYLKIAQLAGLIA